MYGAPKQLSHRTRLTLQQGSQCRRSAAHWASAERWCTLLEPHIGPSVRAQRVMHSCSLWSGCSMRVRPTSGLYGPKVSPSGTMQELLRSDMYLCYTVTSTPSACRAGRVRTGMSSSRPSRHPSEILTTETPLAMRLCAMLAEALSTLGHMNAAGSQTEEIPRGTSDRWPSHWVRIIPITGN